MSRILLLALTLLVALSGTGRPASAASTCVSVVGGVSGDTLVNRCIQCRIVEISHKRRTGGFPIRRSYRLPENGEMNLSFKGSGRARILSDSACEGEEPTTQSRNRQNCVKLSKRPDGLPELSNTCPVCRGVVVARIFGNGQALQQVYTLGGRASLPVPINGASHMAIVSELPCTR